MDWIVYAAIFCGGLLIGLIINGVLGHTFSRYSGTILVMKDEGKTVYTLLLDEYPEKLEFRKQILFRVALVDDIEESIRE